MVARNVGAMMKTNSLGYHIVIVEKEIRSFEARVLELPDIAEYAATYEEVYQLAREAIQMTFDVFQKKGRVMPLPIHESHLVKSSLAKDIFDENH
jgi:predicted RNase H-like HicB family nuclease